MYSDEELEKIDKRLKQVSQDIRDEEKNFWEQEYPKMTEEERVEHWGASLFRSMRTQEEAGQNPYIIYKEKWLKEVLEIEPQFMELLPNIFRIWGGMWDTARIESRLKKLSKKIGSI